jgi:DME family drug/metabolite transporter
MIKPAIATKSPPAALISGRLAVLIAAVMWSTSGFFAKAPLFADWPLDDRGVLLAFWRALFASLVLVPLIRRPRWNPSLVALVLCFAAMNYAFMSAITRTSAANAIWLQNTAPAWVLLVGVWWFGEQAQRRDWLFLPFAMTGVGLIVFFESSGDQWDGILLGLLSGVTYAGVVLLVRHLRTEDGAWLIALSHLGTALIFLPAVVHADIWPNSKQCCYLAGFGIFQMGIPYLLFARGVRHIPGHEASAITLLEPILVPVWVFIAWRNSPTYQPPQWWTFVGGTMILLGLVLRFRRPLRQNQQSRGETEERNQDAETAKQEAKSP